MKNKTCCLRLIDENTTGPFVSCALRYDRDMKLHDNADVPADSSLRVYLLDEHGLHVLPGYGKAEGGQVRKSGLDVEVVWKDKPCLPAGKPFKIRCEITGKTRVFALHLRDLN